MSAIMDMIKAKQELNKAKKKETESIEVYRHNKCVQAFKPFIDALNEVRTFKAIPHRHHSKVIVPLENHIAKESDISISFWNGYGGSGKKWHVQCNEGNIEFVKQNGYENKECITTQEEAFDSFIGYLSDIILTEEIL